MQSSLKLWPTLKPQLQNTPLLKIPTPNARQILPPEQQRRAMAVAAVSSCT
jgi:hypothetical protein